LGLRATPGPSTLQQVGSRESADPPRLVLTVLPTATSIDPGASIHPGRDPRRGAGAATLRVAVAPNPSNPGATISFWLPWSVPTALVTLVDPRGRRVRTLFEGPAAAGRKDLVWDGRDDTGRPLASGVYLVHASAAASTLAGVYKVVLTR
jgi:hypothetical protein